MRECAGVRERQEHPACTPWVHRGGRDELRVGNDDISIGDGSSI